MDGRKTISLASMYLKNQNFDELDYQVAKEKNLLMPYYLKKEMKDFSVETANITLEKIQAGEVDAKKVYLIQEDDYQIGDELVKLGAVPTINFCYESLIYTRPFYERLSYFSKLFKHKVYFTGMFQDDDDIHNHCSIFPAYDNDELIAPLDFAKKANKISLVMGNKYIEHRNFFPRKIRIRTIKKFLKDKFSINPIDLQLDKNELQTKRLELIEFFGKQNFISLQGPMWGTLKNLPKNWQKRLKKIVKKLNPQPVDDKLQFISEHRFNLCVENLSYKGYVTEKIIHSFVAGVIPVYLGSPDICDFVPEKCFVDIRDFKTNKQLYNYLINMDEKTAQAYINNGQEFIKSNLGQRFTHKNVMHSFVQMIRDVSNI